MHRPTETPGSRTDRPLTWWRRSVAFVAWIFRPEGLGPGSTTSDSGPSSSTDRKGTDFLPWLVRREVLEPTAVAAEGPSGGFLGWLLRGEPLPPASDGLERSEPAFLPWLFRQEPLPAAPGGPEQRTPGFIPWLLGRDRGLPASAPAPGEREELLVTWLFRGESLPDPGRLAPKEEA